ncbi:MAG TPA: hypothetical protein VMJ32_18310, partial [Pirellulales bacterium]|nr:hypothetical protein [Pirellulales bacterium]
AEIRAIEQNIAPLQIDREMVGRRMSRESDDERYQFLAVEFDRVSKELKNAELQLENLKSSVFPKVSKSEQVDAAMALFARILQAATDQGARQDLRPLLTELNLWIGLNFVGAIKGKKREVRRIAGGIIAFDSEDLPIRLYGPEHVSDGCSTLSKTSLDQAIPASADAGRKDKHASSEEPPLACPDNHFADQESISFTKVSRGDWI